MVLSCSFVAEELQGEGVAEGAAFFLFFQHIDPFFSPLQQEHGPEFRPLSIEQDRIA